MTAHQPYQSPGTQATTSARADAAGGATGHGGIGLAGTGRFGAVIVAAFLGAVLLYGVALSPVTHKVAHDTRHAIGFPCH